MAKTRPSRTVSLIYILFLLLTTAPEPTRSLSLSLSFAQYRTVVSLSHSLMTRVANLRASRGDVSSSRRAHFIAEKLESGLSLGFFGLTWSLGWDYLENYAWRDLNYAEMYSVVSDVNELLEFVGELTRANSDAERATWVGRNYQNVLGVSTSLFKKLFKVFAKSGALREAVKVAEREVVQGGLLKDCLELGSNDLKGLLQILKDLASSEFISPVLFLLLTTAPETTRSLSLSFAQYRTVVLVSHSLMTRVANLRASRGDVSGSRWAHLIAEKLESGLSLGFFGLMWSLGWDYLENYAWRDLNYAEMYSVVSDVNELLKFVGELTRTNSDAERATWVGRNYQNVLGVSTSLFKKLLKVFAKSGTLREAVKVAEREVVQGGLLKDCLELGSNDLKGLLQILKDLASSGNANTNANANDWREL